jgi:anti-sigma B factor antagonist
MELTEQKSGDITVISIIGKVDTTNYGELEKYTSDILNRGEGKIIIDCEKLEYIASSGLRVFLITLKHVKKINGKLILCSLNDFVKEVFEMSGFSTLFDIRTSKEEALKSF